MSTNNHNHNKDNSQLHGYNFSPESKKVPKTVQEKQEKKIKTQLLQERNRFTKWASEKIIKKLDKHAYEQNMMAFAYIAFFLGNNLNIYIYCFLLSSLYLLVNRMFRFYVKRLLLYFFEFCYFGISLLIVFIIFFSENNVIWYATYVCTTGLMSVSAVVLSNQALFNSTDHITSTWIHTVPMVTCWAIRWRHKLYDPLILTNMHFTFVDVSESEFSFLSEEMIGLCFYPLLFWFFWVCCFAFFFFFVFKRYVENPKYGSSLDDFRKILKKYPFFKYRFLKNHDKIKYCLQHFIGFLISVPIALFCYYNMFVNTLYGTIIFCYLLWNSSIKYEENISKRVDFEKSGVKFE